MGEAVAVIDEEAPVQLCPLALMLFALHASGIFGPKPVHGDLSVGEIFRCKYCKNPWTRMKGLTPIAERLGPIIGLATRCRSCGAPNEFYLRQQAA